MNSVPHSAVKSLCVYCGSRLGNDPNYRLAARELGHHLAALDVRLVYGGGAIGLMGEVASGVAERGGNITGVIPEFLSKREIAFSDAQELILTEDMHARKRIMFERSDAFVALPGGIGTLEELLEVSTWLQLEQHDKPVFVANLFGYWEPLKDLLAGTVADGFVDQSTVDRIRIVDSVEQLLGELGLRVP